MGHCFLYKRGGGGGGGNIVEIIKTAIGKVITLMGCASKPLQGLIIYGHTTQNGTPTPDAPVPLESVGDGGSVGVTVCGKNLLKNNFPTNGTTVWGVNFNQNADGSMTANGTAEADIYSNFGVFYANEGTKYVLTGSPTADGNTGIYINSNDTVGGNWNMSAPAVFHLTKSGVTNVALHIKKGVTLNNITFYPMIRLETVTDATYEPYKDGGSVAFSTPNGLPGIPVSSGGNYTDENGQQWICDEEDCARGKYVQRVGYQKITNATYSATFATHTRFDATFSGTMKPNNKYVAFAMCSHFPYVDAQYSGDYVHFYHWNDAFYFFIPNSIAINQSEVDAWLSNNDLCVAYVLETPIETDLTPEELAQYSALHTNYPNTTIYNDAGADMEVKYISIEG